jgi:predicted amidohydrolase
MRVFCCQLDIVWEARDANLAKVERVLAGVDLGRGDLVVLPEMFTTGFSMDLARVCQGTPPEVEVFLAESARRRGVFVLGGVVNLDATGRGRNEAVAFAPDGQLLARYTKIHPFSHGGEAEHYAAGTRVVTFDWGEMRVAPFICYDLRFPEVFRCAVRHGACLFAVLANWPAQREGHWTTLLQARAIENQAYVVGVNRCGRDPEHAYGGRSLVVDPQGTILLDAGPGETVAGVDVEPGAVTAWRSDFPALRDMRWAG